MAIKIEKKALSANRVGGSKGDWDDFLAAMKSLKVGESFLFPRCESNHRLAMSIAQRWLDARFVTSREEGKFRIGRIM